MDYITTFAVTKENHDAVMVIVDKLTKLVMFVAPWILFATLGILWMAHAFIA
jgi:hypothetical protein